MLGTGRKEGGGLILHIILKLAALLKNQSIAAPFYNIPLDGWLGNTTSIPPFFSRRRKRELPAPAAVNFGPKLVGV